MSKKSFVTNITPLPSSVSREAAIAQLHDHSSMIKLNPLVIRHQPTSPPPHATEEESQKCRWYEITDIMNYLPGGIAKGELTYKGGFYNQPYGLQTHVFAPAGVDIRAKWSVGGNMPGEPRELPELGLDKPKEGLYLREDVELTCSFLLSSFVKRNLKKSHGKLVDDLLVRVHEQEQNMTRRAQSNTTGPISMSSPSGVSSMHASTQKFGPATSHLWANTSQAYATPPQHQEQHSQQRACSCAGAISSGHHRRDCPQFKYSSYHTLDAGARQQAHAPAQAAYQANSDHHPDSRGRSAELKVVAQGRNAYSPARSNPFSSSPSFEDPSDPVSGNAPWQTTSTGYVARGQQGRPIPNGNAPGPHAYSEHAELATRANVPELAGEDVEYRKAAAAKELE